MENYFNVSPIEKLFMLQKDELENQLISNNIELKNADKEEYDGYEKVMTKLKSLLPESDYNVINDMLTKCETLKLKHEDIMFFYFYKLGLKDGAFLSDFLS